MRRRTHTNGTSGAAHHAAGKCEHCDAAITLNGLGEPKYTCAHDPKRLETLTHYLGKHGKPVEIHGGGIVCKICREPLTHNGEAFEFGCGHDAPQFVEPIATSNDDFPLTLAGEIAKPLPPVQWVVQHFGIAPGRPTLLAGYGGIGKTVIAQTIALVVASTKGTWCGLHVAHGHVVHIDYEMGVLANFLSCAFVPEVTRKSIEIARAHLFAKFKAAGKDMKKDGIDALTAEDKQACTDLFKQLAAYGLFVVHCGEVERWLPSLGVSGKGSDWLIPMFERLGTDPTAASYVAPASDDVWEFLDRVARWIGDPSRQGMAF